ncbi:hypothetical protein [Streptomyces sp. NPDC059819]|uniref:hypothetical protein n=1 Tax=Streptomyces sp. NPDC059819 TaxID=3346963 RepID=UPI003650DC15
MTPSFDRTGGKLCMRARAKEASSRLRAAVCSIWFANQLVLATQSVDAIQRMQQVPASRTEYVTITLSLLSHCYQLYRASGEGGC